MRIPPSIIAGDSAQWRDFAFSDALGNSVDSGSYTLTYSLRGPGAAADIVGTANGSGWQFALTTAVSAALNTTALPATWYWQAAATKAGARLTAGDGVLVVKPNLVALNLAPFDGSSQAEKDLAAVRAEMAARIRGGATVEYTIGSRSLKKEPMSELVLIEQRCLRIVSRERRNQAIANGLGNPGRVGIRFK